MDKNQLHTESYIRLSGLQFRSTKVECPNCRWTGTAGNLKVPDLAAFCETPSYACPACRKIIARHSGLNTDEVMEGMQKIQSILAQEFAPTCIDTNKASNARRIDYTAVRSQIQFASEEEQADKSVEKTDKASAIDIHSSSESVNTKNLEPA